MRLYECAGLCRALSLTSEGPQTIRRAVGDRVTLGCTYEWGASDRGDLDIEWSLVSPDTTMKDQMVGIKTLLGHLERTGICHLMLLPYH
jgi:hypothetical protein